MADIRAAAAEIELGLGRRTDPDDPYADMPADDRPDADLLPTHSRDALEEDIGVPLGDLDDLDRPGAVDRDPEG